MFIVIFPQTLHENPSEETREETPLAGSTQALASSTRGQRSAVSRDMENISEPGDPQVVTSSPFASLRQFSKDDDKEREEEEEESADEEEEPELVVLDPNHPLMTRFQTALKSYLTKQIQSLDLELREMSTSMKRNRSEREDLGVHLYSIQQELARLQMSLEKHHDKHSQVSSLRRQVEEDLEAIRDLYKKTHQSTDAERKKVSSIQAEVEDLALRLFYMENVSRDVTSDISVMKRAVQKTEAERMRAELEKKKQDLFVDRLTREADGLRDRVALYEAQIAAQREDTKAAREAVTEANMEIEAIGLEKKQLLQHWHSSLIGMTRRDEAYCAVQEALSLAEQELRSMETEIESYKRSVTREEERNEKLAFMISRQESDAAITRKNISQCQARQEALRAEYNTYLRTLQETEQTLSRVTTDRALRWSALSSLRTQIENESQIKGTLEKQIMEKLQETMTTDKAARYSSLLTGKLQKRQLGLEIDCSKMENESSEVQLEVNRSTWRIKALQKTLDELDKKIEETNALISRSQSEITKRTLTIERKQSTINLYSKQIESALAQIGGKELGPLEIQITALIKQMEECNTEVVAVQQYWLRLQTEMVQLSRQREEQDAAVEMLKKELTILQQRKIRIENEIEQERNEQKDIEHHMKNLRNDLLRLNSLLSKNTNCKEQLQQHNHLMESEFMQALREAERESVELQGNLGNLQEEKERLLKSLVETEHHMMLWEKKIQLAKEMRNAVDSETGQGEIRVMRAEIHRMQVRYTQLMKQQEKMICDMEAVVSRRETITIRGKNLSDKKHPTASDFSAKLQELRRKTKETVKNIEDCSSAIYDLEETQMSLSAAITEKQSSIAGLKGETRSMESDMEILQERKRLNLTQIVANQTRLKHFQAVKEGKYSPVFSTLQSLEAEQQKQENRLHTISTIIHQIQQEYPQYQHVLHTVSLTLEAKLGPPESVTERAP
ncbi:coiled-coil domain-containing protein 40 [Mantella aurantiaca]